MLQKIIKEKIEPASFVLDALYNIVFTNSKVDQLLKNKDFEKQVMQISIALIKELAIKNEPKKINGIKLNKENFSLLLEPLNLKNTKKTYFLFKIEKDYNITLVNNTKINTTIIKQLKKTEIELEDYQKKTEKYARELNLFNEENIAINEELKHLNNEYTNNINTLTKNNDQLQKLLYNSNTATIYLNQQLSLLKYSKVATKLFHITKTDINRSLKDFKNKFIDQKWLTILTNLFKAPKASKILLKTLKGEKYNLIVNFFKNEKDVFYAVLSFNLITLEDLYDEEALLANKVEAICILNQKNKSIDAFNKKFLKAFEIDFPMPFCNFVKRKTSTNNEIKNVFEYLNLLVRQIPSTENKSFKIITSKNNLATIDIDYYKISEQKSVLKLNNVAIIKSKFIIGNRYFSYNFKHNINAVVIYNPKNGQVVFANEKFKKIVNLTENKKYLLHNLIAVQHLKAFRKLETDTLKKQTNHNTGVILIRQNNIEHLYTKVSLAISELNNNKKHIIANFVLIDDFFKTEMQRKNKLQLYEMAFKKSSINLAIYNITKQTFSIFNNAFLKLFGIKTTEIKNYKFRDFLANDDYNENFNFNNALNTPKTTTSILKYVNKNNKIFFGKTKLLILKNEDHCFLTIQIQDVTKELKNQKELIINKQNKVALNNKYQTLLNNPVFGVAIYNFEFDTFEEVNKTWLTILKYSKQKALNTNITSLLAKHQNSEHTGFDISEKIKTQFYDYGKFAGAVKLKRENNATKQVDLNIIKLKSDKNVAVIILSDNSIATQQLKQFSIKNKQLENDILKHKFCLNFSDEGYGIFDISTYTIKEVNAKFLEILDITEKQICGFSPQIFFDEVSTNITLNDFLDKSIKKLKSSKKINTNFFALKNLKTPILVTITAILLPESNNNLVYFTLKDIDHQYKLQIEKETNLNTIYETENRLKTVLNSAQGGFAIVNIMKQEIISCNPKCCEMFGYRKVDLSGSPLNTLLPKSYNKKSSIASYIKNVFFDIKEKQIHKSIQTFTKKNKQDFYAEIIITSLDKLNNNLLLVQFYDKNAEEKIKKKLIQSDTLYNGLLKKLNHGLIIIDYSTQKIFDVNQTFLELFDLNMSYISKNKECDFSKLFRTKNNNGPSKKIKKIFDQLAKNEIERFEFETIGIKQRSKKYFHTQLLFFKLNAPLQNLIALSVIDIDDIKNTELALFEKNKNIELVNKQLLINEEKFRLTFENANNLIARTKLNGELIEHNNTSKLNLLNDNNKIAPKFIWNFPWFKENKFTVSQIKNAYKLLKNKTKIQLEVKYKISINIIGILNLTLTKINKKNNWILVEGNDITEIKSFQTQLSLNEQKLTAIYNNSNNFIARIETNGIISEHNKTVSQLLKDIKNPITTGIYLWDIPWFLKYKASRKALKDALKKASTGVVAGNTISFDLPNHPNRYLQIHITPIYDKNKKIIYFLGEGTDITEVIKSNKAKAIQQTKLNTIFKASKNSIIILNRSGVVEETNENGSKILSKPPFEFINILKSKKYSNLNYNTINNKLKKQFRNTLAGISVSDTVIFKNYENNTLGFEYCFSPIIDSDNKVIKVLLEINEITKRIENETNLVVSEKKYRSLFYNALNFMARLNANGIVLEHNRYKHNNSKFSYIKELIGKPIWTDKFLDQRGDAIIKLKNNIHLSAKGNTISNEINYYYGKNKTPLKLKYTLKPIFDADKNLMWLLLEGNNISDLKNARNKLIESQIKSKYFFENGLVASAIVNKDLKLIETNNAFLKITGYTVEEVNNLGYLNILYNKDIKGAQKNIKNLTKKRFSDAKFKRRFITKSKQLKTAIFSFKPFYQNGGFNGGFITLSDITELETKKQQLSDNIKKYKSLFDFNVTGLAVGDSNGKLLKVNNALCNILGYSEKELLQMNHKQLSYEGEKDKSYLLFKELLECKIKHFTTTKKFLKKDGRIIDTIINVSGVFNDENEFLYNITSISDISDIRDLEVQLENKVKELEKYIESNLELENFAFLASHDLRAPLITVQSFTKILRRDLKDKISKKEYDFLGYISTGVNRLQQSINDLLDFSSVSNNQLKIKNINTKVWLNNILNDFDTKIKNSNAKIVVKKIPKTVNIDESLYARLIQNLIANSLKFIKPNTIPQIEIGYTSNKKNHQFYFKDNGIGIPKKMHDKVFGIFKRLHPNEVYEGTGIGLALCKKVVERHNGKIWIESALGKGTTFYFTLPLK